MVNAALDIRWDEADSSDRIGNEMITVLYWINFFRFNW